MAVLSNKKKRHRKCHLVERVAAAYDFSGETCVSHGQLAAAVHVDLAHSTWRTGDSVWPAPMSLSPPFPEESL